MLTKLRSGGPSGPFYMNTYKDETLRNALVTLKIDGVQAQKQYGEVVSRTGKLLHNVQLPQEVQVAEIFCGTWAATVSAVRTHNSTLVAPEFIYSLKPVIDPRLIVGTFDVLRTEDIQRIFNQYKKDYEGLVIYAGDQQYKVKSTETYDVTVKYISWGLGKHAGRMGALITDLGRVGTGFTDAQREEEWLPGMVIEVECMGLTPKGVFRHARFLRRRWDKE